MIQCLADSGFLYTLFNKDDPDHSRCVTYVTQTNLQIYLPSITLPEVTFLVRRSEGPHKVSSVVRGLRHSPMVWINAELVDYDRACEVMDQYNSAKLDLVDCTIVAMAERLNIQRIFTLDRREFSMIRPRHCAAFELLP